MLTIPASKSFHNTSLDNGNLHSKFLIFTKGLSTYILLKKRCGTWVTNLGCILSMNRV